MTDAFISIIMHAFTALATHALMGRMQDAFQLLSLLNSSGVNRNGNTIKPSGK
jgi:hypothetical protein